MKLQTRKDGGICIVDISGKITLGKATEEMAEKITGLLDSGEKKLLLNMLEVPWLDSSGIGITVMCYKRVKDKQGTVKLAMKGKSHDLFTMYELNKVFEIFSDVDEALASFSG